jgi:uncharacterized protein YkwD
VQEASHPEILQACLPLSGPLPTVRRKLAALLSAVLPLLLGGLAPVLAAARAVVSRRPPPPCPGADLRPGPENAAAAGAATVCLINQQRGAHHLRPLRANHYLQGVAAGQVRQMVHRNYFSDVRPSGQTPAALIASSRYAVHTFSLSTGQDIGWGTGPYQTPASMVSGWMASPPHRAIILAGAFRDIGVGISTSLPAILDQGRFGSVYAVEFAARAPRGR